MAERKLFIATLTLSSILIAGVSEAAMPSGVDDFYKLCDSAMEGMMRDMNVAPTNNVDQDFVAMMIPHHKGAIDMAVAELRYGHDENLKRIAQEIIVDQQQEIAAMRLALHQTLPPSVPAPTGTFEHHKDTPQDYP
jgi:uncharacterized protein (DUF305 family)